MDPPGHRIAAVRWAFWVACGLALTAALAPVVFTAGGTNRLVGMTVPVAIAAAALAALALEHRRGRSFASVLYFVAGLVIVYGILAGLALPLRLAIQGACSPDPTGCPAGLEQPMTGSESNGLTFGITLATFALLAGFIGLMLLYGVARQLAAIPPPRPAPMEPTTAKPAEAAATRPAGRVEAKPVGPAEAKSAQLPAPAATDVKPAPPTPGTTASESEPDEWTQ